MKIVMLEDIFVSFYLWNVFKVLSILQYTRFNFLMINSFQTMIPIFLKGLVCQLSRIILFFCEVLGLKLFSFYFV